MLLRRKYLDSLAEMVKLRTEIENYKSELENCRHIRHIYEKEEFDEFNNLIPGEREKEFMEFIAQKEYLLNAYIENCHVALIDFKSMVQELNEAKKALEDSFQVRTLIENAPFNWWFFLSLLSR